MSSLRRLSRHCALLSMLLFGLITGTSPAIAQAAAQTGRIQNTATLSFDDTGSDSGIRTVPSNTVSLDVNRAKWPTTLTFHLPPPNYEMTGAKCQTTPSFLFTPAPIDAATYAASPWVAAIDVYADMILVLDNQAGNHDPDLRETAIIAVDAGTIHTTLTLTETAADSGIFAGGIPAVATGKHPELAACDVRNVRGASIKLSFAEDGYSLASMASLLIDPAGYTFDSRTGALVDGTTVSLVDEAGQPATVFGDDGKSRYPSTVVTGEAVTDASGRVYPGETGRYRFPLSAPGRYFLEIAPPGTYTAPSTVDRATLAALKDPQGRPFILNDTSFGGSLTLSTPEPFSADIPLDSPGAGTLLLTKVASVREASPGDFVQYLLRITNRDSVPARGLHVADTLPKGLRYERNSARGGDEPTVSTDGRKLDFVIPVLAAGASTELKYVVSIAPGAPTGEALNRARVVGQGTVTSNEAAASVRLRPLLFTDAMTIIGRVTEGNCGDPVNKRKGVPGIRLLMEDGTFVSTDRDGLYHFEGVRAGRHVVQIDTSSIPATHAPVACDIDTRQANSPISRFVEGDGGLLKRVDFQLKPTGKAAVADAGLPIAVADAAVAAGSRDWLAGEQAAGIDWLFPEANHNPRAPIVRAVVKHAPGQRVALTINGKQVEPLAFDGTDQRDGTDIAVSRWTGIPLIDGDNRLQARVLAADGSVVKTLDRTVHYAGPGVRAVFDAASSRLVADGLTRPLIAVRVTDKTGRPVRAGTLVPFTVDQPYTAAVEAELEQGRQLAGRERSSNTALVVGDDGLAFIALQPTTQAGAVHVVVSLAEEKIVHTSEVRAWLRRPRTGSSSGSVRARSATTCSASASRACPGRSGAASSPTASSLSMPRGASRARGWRRSPMTATANTIPTAACSARSIPIATTPCTVTARARAMMLRRAGSCTCGSSVANSTRCSATSRPASPIRN